MDLSRNPPPYLTLLSHQPWAEDQQDPSKDPKTVQSEETHKACSRELNIDRVRGHSSTEDRRLPRHSALSSGPAATSGGEVSRRELRGEG